MTPTDRYFMRRSKNLKRVQGHGSITNKPKYSNNYL
jgi:hypothetical protein